MASIPFLATTRFQASIRLMAKSDGNFSMDADDIREQDPIRWCRMHTHETVERDLRARSKAPRLLQLDALRGLAAVTVVIYHCRYAFQFTESPWYLVPFTSGTEAVVLFFVLSGYVLSLPHWRGRKIQYGAYLVRRICRIYLPYVAALVLSVAGASLFFGSRLPLSRWFYLTWQTPFSWQLLFKQLMMWPMPDFNTAFWSLRYEMQLSFVMPAICVILKRWNAAAMTVALCVAVYGRPTLFTHVHWHWMDKTIEVAFFFILGATLAFYQKDLEGLFEKIGDGQWIVLATSLFLYFEFPLRLIHGHLYEQLSDRRDLMCAIGSAGIILCSLHLAPFKRILEHSLPEYLGRISYSLYLTHSIVLFALLDILYGHVPNFALGVLICCIAIAAAHLFCIAVEEPSMRAGKVISASLQKSDK
jgi:peptidoglycan/LPS O-acetylase OafA/YrhL